MRGVHLVSGLVVTLSLVSAGLLLYPLREGGWALAEAAMLIGTACAVLMLGLALAANLSALAAAHSSQHGAASPRPATPPAADTASADLAAVLSELQKTLAARSAGPPSEARAPAGDAVFQQRVISLLEDLREIALMNDAERNKRLATLRAARRELVIDQARRLVLQQQWAAADAALARLETDDTDTRVVELRQHLAQGRMKAQSDAFGQLRDHVENLMAIASWDQALAATRQFAADFPDFTDGQKLLQRVQRESELFREGMAQRLYDEAKREIEHKNWRRALAGTQRLLERFPDHPRALKMRQQLSVIQDNAEIEERQDQEQRIQDLVRSRRFDEAIQLAEALIERFPRSPQAESLEQLLPKLRSLAVGGSG